MNSGLLHAPAASHYIKVHRENTENVMPPSCIGKRKHLSHSDNITGGRKILVTFSKEKQFS